MIEVPQTYPEIELARTLRRLGRSNVRGGLQAETLVMAAEAWAKLSSEECWRVAEEYGLEPDDEGTITFGDLAEEVTGLAFRTLRRRLEIWPRLVPEAQWAWSNRRITQQMAMWLAALDPAEQADLLPHMLGRRWSELPTWVRGQLVTGRAEPTFLLPVS